MRHSPYRTTDRKGRAAPGRAERLDDGELVPVYAVLWLVLVARVIVGLVRGEVFGAGLTIALAGVLALPWLAKDGAIALSRRLRACGGARKSRRS
jgi:hypothetical protein